RGSGGGGDELGGLVLVRFVRFQGGGGHEAFGLIDDAVPLEGGAGVLFVGLDVIVAEEALVVLELVGGGGGGDGRAGFAGGGEGGGLGGGVAGRAFDQLGGRWAERGFLAGVVTLDFGEDGAEGRG